MNITVHCKNIDWDTDEEEVDLPKECDVNIELDSSGIADELSDKYGFCVNSLDCTCECDANDLIDSAVKILKKNYKSYCKKNPKSPEFEKWLSDFKKLNKMIRKMSCND